MARRNDNEEKSSMPETSDNVVVVGLGRFGGSVAESLVNLGHEVLGIDSDPRIVQDWSDRLTHVVEADATDTDALRQLGVQDFSRAVVGIGTNLETSVLTVLTLAEVGVSEIWAKATSQKHGQILSRVGARHVIHPESEMGERVAHLITGRMLDYIEFDDGFAISKVRAPEEAVGRSLAEIGLRSKWGVTVVGTKLPGQDFTYARPETVVPEGCLLIVAGDTAKVERFAGVTKE
ncbi:potassium channel family protein [Actinoplanes sp. RD1]|uniref:potassium channel family protein n=1 Tax=Actinoplanes sp. RD1 TaxID=3064538 RepID=UPI0027413E48|nr:TrkA family potassium uptake protein [Actinoplanes sp. RD1]